MKITPHILCTACMAMLLLSFSGCKKKKGEEPAPNDPINPNPPELITTLKLSLTDTSTHITTVYSFSDLDGDGGNAGAYGGTNQSDSVITLLANHAYTGNVLLIDESVGRHDTISAAVSGDESAEHMFFYNGNPANAGNNYGNTVLSHIIPYTVKTNGSNITIKYTDTDNGTPIRNIGLNTLWYGLSSSSGNKYPLELSLKHQPGEKDGTYMPGETDVLILFKVLIQ